MPLKVPFNIRRFWRFYDLQKCWMKFLCPSRLVLPVLLASALAQAPLPFLSLGQVTGPVWLAQTALSQCRVLNSLACAAIVVLMEQQGYSGEEY